MRRMDGIDRTRTQRIVKYEWQRKYAKWEKGLSGRICSSLNWSPRVTYVASVSLKIGIRINSMCATMLAMRQMSSKEMYNYHVRVVLAIWSIRAMIHELMTDAVCGGLTAFSRVKFATGWKCKQHWLRCRMSSTNETGDLKRMWRCSRRHQRNMRQHNGQSITDDKFRLRCCSRCRCEDSN